MSSSQAYCLIGWGPWWILCQVHYAGDELISKELMRPSSILEYPAALHGRDGSRYQGHDQRWQLVLINGAGQITILLVVMGLGIAMDYADTPVMVGLPP